MPLNALVKRCQHDRAGAGRTVQARKRTLELSEK
jgi:hypothetical protein